MDQSKVIERGSTFSLMECNACGKMKRDNEVLLIGEDPHVVLCSDCVDKIFATKKAIEERETNKAFAGKGLPAPSKLKEHLDKYVIGQEKAKKILSVAVYNHCKRYRIKERNGGECDIDKSNVFLIGASGSGKTYLLKTLAKALKAPFVIADATSFTSSGYVGRDVETILTDLYNAADKNIDEAEHGIVYIDEIDKIGRKGENLSTTADPGNEGTQQALLKLIEGSIVKFPTEGGRVHPQKECLEMNTENILFIVGGAFEGIEKIIAKRQNKGKAGIGFGSSVKKVDEAAASILDAKAEDLKKFGMIPELIGRIPVICPLEKLDEEALVNILTKPKRAIISQYKELFAEDGVEFTITDEALHYVAKRAIKMGTGARALRSIMEEILTDIMYDTPDKLPDVTKVTISMKDGEPSVEYTKAEAEEMILP